MRGPRDYATITASYWAFTLTDGALRMLVLFHLHRLGHSPLEVVSLFLFYELFGVVTNLLGGWLGGRFGLRATLLAGLSLQITACAGLALAAEDLTLPVVMVAQALSGVAKDLTKMSAKSYVRLLVPPGEGARLLRLVAVLTGSKNALKGLGFFLGGVLLETAGFRGANAGMAAALALALAASAALLPRAAGRAATPVALRRMFAADPRVHWLSAARLFLFGSRDVWFVFALPVFLAAELAWTTSAAGAFLAAWVIGYGIVQASAPAWIGARGSGRGPPDARRVLAWTAALVAPLAAIAAAVHFGVAPAVALVAGLALYGAVFATDSAMHSYLIVHYAEHERVAQTVGFYYMANAAGRLAGTVLSGAVFQWAGMGAAGLAACLLVAIAFVVLSATACVPLHAAEVRRAAASG